MEGGGMNAEFEQDVARALDQGDKRMNYPDEYRQGTPIFESRR